MKPNFALNLSHSGISLYHRGPAGWHTMGEVALDNPDMNGELERLRSLATTISSSGLASKLVIPNRQILYRTLPDPGGSNGTRINAIRATLDGTTPYAVDELVWDWRAESGTIYVAVVARETLNEAEGFAAEYRFNPVSFVAMPDPGTFKGEPFFGRSNAADDIVGAGVNIEPDNEAIVVRAGATPRPAAAPVPIVEPEQEPDPVPVDEQVEKPVEEAMAWEDATPEPVADEVPDPTPDPEASEVDTPDVSAEDTLPQEEDAAPQDEAPHPEIEDRPPLAAFRSERDADTEAFDTAPESDADTNGSADELAQSRLRAQASRLFTAGDTPPKPAPRVNKPPLSVTAASLPEDATPNPILKSKPKPAPRASRDGALPEPPPMPTTKPAISTVTSDAEASEPADDGPSRISTAAASLGAAGSAAGAALGGAIGSARTKLKARQQDRAERKAAELADTELAAAAQTLHGEVTDEEDPRFAAHSDDLEPQDPALAAAAHSLTEEDALTVFGARRRNRENRNKPKYMGLILTGSLIVVLLLVVLWESFLPDPEPQTGAVDPSDAAIEAPATPNSPFAPTTTIVTRTDEGEDPPPTQTDEPQDTAATPETDIAQNGALSEDVDAAPAVIPTLSESALPAPLTPATAIPDLAQTEAHFAATGVWQSAPSGGAARDDDEVATLYLTSIDPQITSQDAVALPEVSRLFSDLPPRIGLSPVPQDTEFDLNERGLVRATSEGALSPTGVMVFAGPPPVVTGLRPERAPVAPDASPTALDENDPLRIALQARAPQLRPAGLVENTERARLGGISRNQLAAFVPHLRPASPQQAAQADAEEDGEVAPAPTAPVVVTSRVPTPRPINTAKLAAAARAAAQAAALVQPVSAPAPVATPTPAAPTTKPVTKPKVPTKPSSGVASTGATTTNSKANRVTAKVPKTSIPKSIPATVAKAATQKNQINLRKLNLMGIYGASSDRRALLRLPSGKLTKVKIGDRVNGGRVQTISASALTYVKNGRSVTLKVGG